MIRIWDKKGRRWLHGFVIDEEGRIYINQVSIERKYADIAVNYFTGLTDEIGIKIFEDDILDMAGIVGVVKYISPSFVLLTKDGFYPICSLERKKVLGNIHEHCNLLVSLFKRA